MLDTEISRNRVDVATLATEIDQSINQVTGFLGPLAFSWLVHP